MGDEALTKKEGRNEAPEKYTDIDPRLEDISLRDLEVAANNACQEFNTAREDLKQSMDKTEAAKKAFEEASAICAYGVPTPENIEKREQARKALEEAQAEEEAANKAFETAAESAQEAIDNVEDKKTLLRRSRSKDTTYVVHCARVECPYGLRESYLALDATHGVLTRQVPQMTINDTVLNTNIINFGGCHSLENPSVKEAAEAAAKAANEQVHSKENWGFRDWVTSLFVKEKEIEVTESLMEKCIGECKAEFPPNAKWMEGEENVFVNNEPVLMRKCSLTCNYGGQITILLSGQPD